MSAQGAKKKRIGSRRRVANQDKTSRADEFPATDGASAAQGDVPEENTESLNVSANLDSSQSEMQDLPSPELTGSRRKLGSSRRNRGGQHVRDSHHKEEVEETLETTQMLLAIKHERQEELSGHGGEYDAASAIHGGSFFSTTTADYSSEVQNFTTTSSPEADLQSVMTIGKDLKAERSENEPVCETVSDSGILVETMLEETDISDTLHCEEVKESAHPVCISETSLLSCHPGDQQLIDPSSSTEMPDELPNVYPVTPKQKDENTELSRQDEHLEGNDLLSESHVKSEDKEFSVTPEVTTERRNVTEQTEPACSVEQAVFSSPKEELSTNEEQNEISSLFEVKGAQQSEDVANKVHKQEIKPTQMHELDYSSQSVTQDATENSELFSGNLVGQAEVSDRYQSELIIRTSDASATKQEDSNPDDTVLNTQEQEGVLSEAEDSKSSLQSLQSEMNPPPDSQTYSPEVQNPTATNCPEADPRGLIPESTNHDHEDHDERETDFKVEVCDKSVGATREGEDESDTLQRQEARGAHHSEEAVNIVHEQAVRLTEVQEMHEINYSSECGINDSTEKSEVISGSLVGPAEVCDIHQSELIVKSTDDSATKQEDSESDDKQHPLEANDVEALDHTNEINHAYDTKKPQISDTKIADTDLGQIYETEGHVEDDVKTSAEQAVHRMKEGLFSVKEESGSSLENLQSEIHLPSDSQPQQSEIDSNPIRNRRKLGSSRRNKVRQHAEDSVADSFQRPTEEAVGKTSNNEPVETMLEGTDKFHTAQTEEGPDQVKENAHDGTSIGISELPSLCSHSRSTVDQQLIDPSCSTEMSDELPNVYPVTPKQKDENTELSRQDESLQDNDLLSESHVKSGDKEFSVTPEVTTERRNVTEQTEPACSVEQAVFSSPKEELSTNEEQNGIFILSEVKGAQHSEDVVDKQEIKPTQKHERDYSCDRESAADTELSKQDGHLQGFSLLSESRVESIVIQSSITPQKTGVKRDTEENSEVECSVDGAVFSSPKEELLTNEEQKEHVNVSHAQHSEDAVDETHEQEVKPTEMHQTDYSSVHQTKSSLQTSQSEISALLDSQPLDSSQGFREQTHTAFNPAGNRRKLGSSRRKKGQQQVKDSFSETYHRPQEEYSEKARSSDACETTKMSTATEILMQQEFKEQTDLYLEPAETGDIRSTVNDTGITDKMPDEDTTLSQNIIDNSTIVTTDITSGSGKVIKEPENLSQLKMDSIDSAGVSVWKDDSGIENISYHDDRVTADAPEQEEASQVQNTEALSRDKDKQMNMQQTHDAIETVGEITMEACYTEAAESSIDPRVSEHDEVGEKCKEPMKADHEAQEMYASQKTTHAELFSAAPAKPDALAPLDTGVEPAVDVSEESGISTAVGAGDSQQRVQGQTRLDNSKQKRRKIGSTRRTQLNRKPEGGMDGKDETKENGRNLEEMEVAEELPMTVTAEVSHNENAKPPLGPEYTEPQETTETRLKLQSSTSDLESIQSKMISDMEDLKALLPEECASHNEEVVSPVKFVQVADKRDSDSDRNVGVSAAPSQLDDFTSTDVRTASVLAGSNRFSVNPLPPSNTEDATNTGITAGSFVSLCETTQSAQNHEERPESVIAIQVQALKSAPVGALADLEIEKSVDRRSAGDEPENDETGIQEPNDVNEGAHNANPEMKNASPTVSSTNRRRKMGSTRRNLHSRTKMEDLHQEQEVDNEATETAAKTECLSGVREKELQLHAGHRDSDSLERNEKTEFETVEHSHAGESHFKPQLLETGHQLSPDHIPAIPSNSPKHVTMSESASGGRKRKMGSHRKSHSHQNNENQSTRGDPVPGTENGRGVRSVADKSAVVTAEEEYLGLNKISEEDGSEKKPSSNIPSTKAGEQSSSVSEKTPERVTPVQQPYADVRLVQETFSLGNPRGGLSSFNVVMVGDSSVGKTSFIRRARSGTFSSDLPASIGIDSCTWTALVDGKPVLLQLWDTAGQERFHSITKQIFHKAQAFLLMYDITSPHSFSAVSYWASCIQEGAADHVTVLLLGNKSDHAERRVKTQEGETLAKEYNFEFMECSAATGEHVTESLEAVARMLSQKVDAREETTMLHKEPRQKQASGCC